nr:MAG TPA: hypothetical protein [Caudoviricetes sp.]
MVRLVKYFDNRDMKGLYFPLWQIKNLLRKRNLQSGIVCMACSSLSPYFSLHGPSSHGEVLV